MSRWRPPSPKSSPYITPAGERALKDELKQLWLLRRREVVPALQAAAAEGDRSENAEYIYRKKQLGEIDRRVRYLSKRLDVVEVVVDPVLQVDDVAQFLSLCLHGSSCVLPVQPLVLSWARRSRARSNAANAASAA